MKPIINKQEVVSVPDPRGQLGGRSKSNFFSFYAVCGKKLVPPPSRLTPPLLWKTLDPPLQTTAQIRTAASHYIGDVFYTSCLFKMRLN